MATTPPSLTAKIITQTIAMVFFVFIPIGITLMAPFTDIAIRKTAVTAEVSVKRYVLMFIPWRTQTISDVTALRAEITAEEKYQNTSENRRKGRTGTSVATGQLVIVSKDSDVVVQTAPELATKISEQFAELLTSSTSETLHFSVYANWLLSYIVGGIASFFTAFYVLSASVALVISLFKLLRS